MKLAPLLAVLLLMTLAAGGDERWASALAGVVVDEAGTPRVGVGVEVRLAIESSRSGPVRVRTDEEGEFRIEGLAAGSWLVTACEGDRPVFPPRLVLGPAASPPKRAEVPPLGVPVELPPGGAAEVRLVLGRSARLTIRVRRAPDGPARSIVAIVPADRSAAGAVPVAAYGVTDAAGVLTRQLPPGRYVARVPGTAAHSGPIEAAAGAEVTAEIDLPGGAGPVFDVFPVE